MNNIATFQDAFRKIQTVESIYLNDTVQHFRNHAMELSKSELKELTDVLENDVCNEIERITTDLHVEYFNKADRDCQLATLVGQMSESDRRTFQIYDFLMYPWRDGAPEARLLLIDCFEDNLFFLTPNVVVTRYTPEEVNKAIVMLMHLFHVLTIADFQKIAVPMHCNVEGYLYALLTGRVSRELDPLCHIDELEMAVLYCGRHNDLVQELFRLHHMLMKIYADGKLF